MMGNVRYLSLSYLVILLGVIFSPAMADIWIRLGTGNANFLFFPGLATWCMLAFFICEYLIAYDKRHKELLKKSEDAKFEPKVEDLNPTTDIKINS